MEKRTFYNNIDFNNIDSGGYDKSVVKGQFPTGCADPYIMRYNGMYYLYVTTSGLTNYGLRAWKSRDLLHWDKCQGKGLPLGYVVDDKDENGRYTQNAYAPEVYYFNGKFYMIISPGPQAVSPLRGHRILVSDSPEGPFEAHSEQIDTRIDGTLLIDDDESIYFAHATPFGITIHEFFNMRELGEGALIKASDGTGAWTEGPGFTKVRGDYYLTYTGCHYQTPGYQVIYATTNHLDKTNIQTIADSFKRGPSRVVILNCDKDEGHVGLGHSINFMGPDLDSYYICYHNLDALYEDGMTHRSFNIDRLLLNHGLMTSVQNKEHSVYPKFPFFESFGLEQFKKKGNYYLSNKSSLERFSIEFNSKGGEDVKYLFSYKDEKNYSYVHVDYFAHEITLFKVEKGQEKFLAKGTLKYLYNIDDNQTIRIAYDGVLNIYFNNLLKISLTEEFNKGLMGYWFKKDDFVIGYSAISDEANGSSDRHELKQALGEIPAFDSLEDNHLSLVSLKDANSEYSLTKALVLDENQIATYFLYFKEDSDYHLLLTVNKNSLDKKIKFKFDNQEIKMRLPKVPYLKEDIVRLSLPFIKINKGEHTFAIESGDEQLEIVSFSFAKVDNHFTYENTCETNMEGIHPITEGYAIKEKELVVEGRRNFAYISSQLLTDVMMEGDIRLDSVTEEKGSIGFMVRQNNYAYSDVPKQDFKDANTHIQGYYVEIKEKCINLSRYNFGDVKSYVLVSKEFSSNLGKYHHYRIVIKDNNIQVFMDNHLLFNETEALPFMVGACSLYSYRSKGAYKNIKIQTIDK